MTTRIQPGTNLDGKYIVHKRLGGGNFGDVYEADQLVFDKPLRRVALKLFSAEVSGAEDLTNIFADVIAILQLSDTAAPPDIAAQLVQIWDMGVLDHEGQCCYMSMQLVPGKTLARPILQYQDTGMPVLMTLDYLCSLLKPLAWMHDHDFIHGDLKPDNLLLNEREDIVLADFGLAAHVQLGTLGGELTYQSPETLSQAGGKAQADIYSVGLIWYQMLTGKNPFSDVALGEEDPKAIVQAHIAARELPIGTGPVGTCVPTPESINLELEYHPQLTKLVRRCLSPSITDRFANAGMLLHIIEEYRSTGVADTNILPVSPTAQTDASMASGKGAPLVQAPPRDAVADALAMHSTGRSDDALNLLDEDTLEQRMARARILTDQARELDAAEKKAASIRINKMLSEAIKSHNDRKLVFETLAYFLDMQGLAAQAANARREALSRN